MRAEKYTNDINFGDYEVSKKDTLNFFDIRKNSNKFYTIELHEGKVLYRIFTEYGRLGMTSQKQVRLTASKIEAIKEYQKILNSKLDKGYVKIDLAQTSTGSTKSKEQINTNHIIPTKKRGRKKKSDLNLDINVSNFIKQIFDEAETKLTSLVKGNTISSDTFPLGKLTKYQIDKGRLILGDISKILKSKGTPVVASNDIIELSNDYYRQIPKSFGKKPSIFEVSINTMKKLNDEMEILDFYEDSLKMSDVLYLKNTEEQYKSLNADIDILDPKSDKYKDLVRYVKDSQSKNHDVDLIVERIYTVKQHNYKFDDSVGNVRELFHGTRSANLPAILSSYLKKPNQLKGVQLTGAMFGAGIYFANQSTKSSQYSCSKFGGTKNKYPTNFLLVCSVALGKMKEVEEAHYFNSTPRGYDSVYAKKGKSLLHDEFIVYKENRVRIDYIIEFKTKNRR